MNTSTYFSHLRQVLRRKGYLVLMLAIYTSISGCSSTYDVIQNSKVTGRHICPVCEIYISSEAESYDYWIDEKLYLFESYECKQVFKKNPVKFSINGSISSVVN